MTSESSLEYAVTQARSHKLISAIGAIVLVGAISAIGYFAFFSDNGKQIESIAVMPFDNESGIEDVESLSHGMTQRLISSLSNIPDLSVKASSTVFYLKDKNLSTKKIGEALNVEAVLLGKLSQRGEDLSLNLELVDVKTENVLWSEQFDRKMDNLVSLQTEIARDVSRKLKRKLSGAEENKVTKAEVENSEAYQAYLKGLYQLDKRSGDSIKRGAEFFKEAIDHDPNYALAWSGLADSYTLMPNYADIRSSETLPKAHAAAEKAHSLDPNLAEAHTSLAQVLRHQWKFEESEKEFRKAIELNPKYHTAHQWYSSLLTDLGRHDEAIKEAKIALRLEPLSMISNVRLAGALFEARRTVAAIEQARNAVKTFPDAIPSNGVLMDMLAHEGRFSDAILVCKRFVQLSGRRDCPNVLAHQGKKQEVEKLFKAERVVSDWLEYQQRARVYSILNEKDKAFEILERLYRERSPYLYSLGGLRAFDNLRDDPRYTDLIKRIGLPEQK